MRVPRKLIAQLVQFVAGRQGARVADLDVAVVSRREMAGLNWQYLRHRGTTDVLTFDLSDKTHGRDARATESGTGILPVGSSVRGERSQAEETHGRDAHATRGIDAQIIVCADVAVAVGPPHCLSPRNELLLYVTHGLLHLMGYDDKTIAGAATMQACADQLLREFLEQ
jgi:probable rRNA maturation factor